MAKAKPIDGTHGPERSVAALPPVARLRDPWRTASDALNAHRFTQPEAEWFTLHVSISEADLTKEPHGADRQCC